VTADVLVPTSADEAASLYGDGAEITVVGGGTILLPEIAVGRARPGRALMLHRAGLDTVGVEGGTMVIGAMVPIAARFGARQRSAATSPPGPPPTPSAATWGPR
jgi:CO/xanthine dehydrogenase FAD-binding subunit